MKNQKIIITFTEEDLEELREGKIFNWTYPTDKNEDIDVELKKEE